MIKRRFTSSRCKNMSVLIVVAGFIVRAVRRKPVSLLESSPLSLTALCSTSGNRRNEEHYSGGWKTPLITSRRAVRYPPDLPPTGGVRFAQIAFSLLGRRSARLRSGRGDVSPLVLRLLFRTGGSQQKGEGERGGGMDDNTRERKINGRRTLERWEWI